MENNIIKAPFSKEQVKAFNKRQKEKKLHPYTCNGDRNNCPANGILIATEEGLICPCGKYKQNWFWKI